MKILVLNGPNLNLLGLREPELYGTTSMEKIEAAMSELASELGAALVFKQSNHEGDLIDYLHQGIGKYDGVILNPGGLTHTSVSLADALRSTRLPAVEVHVSNIFAREEQRKRSLTAEAALGIFAGLGWKTYLLALRGLVDYLRKERGTS